MSNQTKVGLLLGLGVVLLVGIIISDHLATQSQNRITDSGPTVSTIGEINNTNQPPGIRDAFLPQAPIPTQDYAIGNPQAAAGAQLPPVMVRSAPVQENAASTNTPPTAIATDPRSLTGNAAMVSVSNPTAPAGGTQTALVNPLPQQPAAIPTPAPQAPTKPQRTYVIKEGDTLSSIASATLGSRNRWKDILDANTKTLGNAKGLKIGTQIVIPETEAKTAPTLAVLPTRPARTYTVGKGDLLGAIAAKTMGSTKKVQALVDANRKALPQGEKTILKTGMVLTIPAQ